MSVQLLDAYFMFKFVYDDSILVSFLGVHFMSTFVFDVSMSLLDACFMFTFVFDALMSMLDVYSKLCLCVMFILYLCQMLQH